MMVFRIYFKFNSIFRTVVLFAQKKMSITRFEYVLCARIFDISSIFSIAVRERGSLKGFSSQASSTVNFPFLENAAGERFSLDFHKSGKVKRKFLRMKKN